MPSFISTGIQGIVTTQFNKTSSTALSALTGVSAFQLAASRSYTFKAIMYATGSTGSAKFGFTGTATATTFRDMFWDHILLIPQTGTALTDTFACNPDVLTDIVFINGYIKVNAAGTFGLSFAQNVSSGTASSVLVGSRMCVLQREA